MCCIKLSTDEVNSYKLLMSV